MATVVPFRAWRYELSRVGSLFQVAAPPYDVIGRTFQEELYSLSPYNVVRVDLGKTYPEDDERNNRYTRAAAALAQWKAEGVLVRDPEPTVTIVEESYVGPDGRARIRRGFLALVRLYEFNEGVVFPHENTLSGPKRDRYQLMEQTRMSLSPVFMLYSLPDDGIMATWDEVGEGRPPAASMTDPAGTTTRLWPTAHPVLLDTIHTRLADAPLLIADGHHRYETALRYRDARREQGDGEGPWDYALVYLCNMDDPGLAIFATHRLVKGLPPETVAALPGSLERYFGVEELTADSAEAPQAVLAFLAAHGEESGAFGLHLPGRGTYGLSLRDPGAPEAAARDNHSEAYHRLDVAILHNLILRDTLGVTPDDVAAGNHITFVKNCERAFERLARGESQVGFFMNPIKLHEMRKVAMGGERLPQKSTYFYPKLPTGLVFYDLEGEL